MKEITLEQFANTPEKIVLSALSVGDIITINAGHSGKAILMEEAEYNILREALAKLIAQNSQ